MVIMRNLRLPELDKNRNVDQQKALVFESKTCKYDVILGADFLTKTGIDVKYSTRTIEWLDNELPLRDPYSLTNRDTLAMAVGVARRSASRKNLRNEKPSHFTKHVTHSLLQDELDNTTHEKQITGAVTNPFAFK